MEKLAKSLNKFTQFFIDDCDFCNEQSKYNVLYELNCGAIHEDKLCLECIRRLIKNSPIKKLSMRLL